MASLARTSLQQKSPPPRFRLEGELARGGMGVVYKAYDELAKRSVALKRPLTAEPRALAAFAREYRTLVGLKHPRIIDVYDYGVDGQGPWYTMELLDGADLRARCPLPWREAAAVLRDVASSLALLHARSLLHRDVSPLNVRLTADQRAKLLDFGALVPFGRQEHVVGTPPCLAPEVLDGASLDQRVDLYALGAVAYYALTGRHAYEARSIAALRGIWALPPAPPSQHAPDVPPLLDELVLALLSLDPLARPTNAAEVIDRLSAIAELPDEHDERVVYSYFRHPRLVGRDELRARLEARLTRLREGQGGALLVEGDAGLGKSALLSELEREARLSGALVLSVNARAERTLFATLHALLDRAELELGEKLARPGGTLSARQSHGSVAADNDSIAQARAPFEALAARRPLVLIVDDVHYVDTGSLAVLITIARGASTHPIMLVLSASGDGDDAQVALRPLRRHAQRLRLTPLSPCDTEELVRSIFGDVPGVKRLAGFLGAHAEGSPLLIMEVLSELVEAKQIRYADGAWVLPHELPSAQRRSLADGLRRRIARAGGVAAELAACLSVELRGLERAFSKLAMVELGLSEQEGEAALEALVRERVLVGQGECHAFAHGELRAILYAGLAPDRRSRMHAVRARQLIENSGPDDLPTLYAAAAHYALAGDRANADRYSGHVEISRYLDQLIGAVPDIRVLYAHEPAARRDRYHVLRLSFCLLIAGLYIDPTLHDQLGMATTDLLERRSGLSFARRNAPRLGATLSVVLGILLAYVWYLLTPRARRWETFGYPLAYFGACASMSNQATLRLDVVTQSEIMARLAPVAKLPRTSAARLVYDALEGASMYLHGRFSDANRRVAELPGQLAAVRDMDEGSRIQYKHSLHFWAGRSALARVSREALDHAAALDRSAVSMDWIGAQFLRTAYHLARGELTEAEAARDVLDELTARHGQNWSADVMLALEFPSYSLAGDVVGLKRAVLQLEGLVKLHPTLRLALEVARAMHEGHLGRPAQAVARYEALEAELAPFQTHLWSFAWGHWARCLNELARHEEARERCARALALVGPAADEVLHAYQELAREHAMALAGLGQLAAAERELDALLARHGDGDQPLLLGLLHRDRTRLAALARDAHTYALHLAETRLRFVATKNPALRSQLARLLELATEPGLEVALDMDAALAVSDAVDLRTLVTSDGRDPRPLEQRLVEHLAQLAGAERARLYLLRGQAAHLVAECGSDRWPELLDEEVRELVQGFSDGEGLTTVMTDASSTGPMGFTTSARPSHRLFPLVSSVQGLRAVLAIADAARPDELTEGRLARFALVLDG